MIKTAEIENRVRTAIENDEAEMDFDLFNAYLDLNAEDDDEINDFYVEIFEDAEATDEQVSIVINNVRDKVKSVVEGVKNGDY